MSASSSVVRTAYDALLAKQSALKVGYQPVKENPNIYADLVEAIASYTPSRKRQSPLVNAGYAARIAVVTSTIDAFIKFNQDNARNLQLVIIGGGLDILGLWASSLCPNKIEVFEIDTDDIFREKRRILTSAGLVQPLTGNEHSSMTNSGAYSASIIHKGNATSKNYNLRSCDLRDMRQLQQALSQVDCSLPTLVLSELVLAYLGRVGVDEISRFIAEHLCANPTSAFVAFEALGPAASSSQNSVIEGYKARYYQKFVDKLERGLAKSNPDDVFHPLGSNALAVEMRFERIGFAFAKACLAGHAAACLTTLVAPEPFDEHAALALHLHAYVLAISFSQNVPLKFVRAMCPWSNVPKQDVALKSMQVKDGVSIIVNCIETSHQQVVQDLFVRTYQDLATDWKAVRKMVKTALKTDMQASDTDPCIARRYAMRGGAFLVALNAIDRTVIGCIGYTSCHSPQPSHPVGLICFEVNRLLVDSSSRGKGIGKALLQACHESIELQIGSETPYAVVATTPQILTAANRLYPSSGYCLQNEAKIGCLILNTYMYCKRSS